MSYTSDVVDFALQKWPHLADQGPSPHALDSVEVVAEYHEGYSYSEYTQADSYTDIWLKWEGGSASLDNEEVVEFLNWVWARDRASMHEGTDQ